MEIGIFNETNEVLEELKIIDDFLHFAAKKLKLEEAEFNVIIVGNKKIRELNKTYREKDVETDVISFALEDDNIVKNPGIRVLGDIYISIDKVKEQAELYDHSLLRELAFLAIHGFLHLLKYDHIDSKDEQIMFSLQKEILDEYGIKK